MSASPAATSSSVCAMSRTTALYSRNRSTIGSISDERLGLLAVLGRIALHLGRAEPLQQLLVLPFGGCQLVEHMTTLAYAARAHASSIHPPETGGRNATSSPSASDRSIRA